MPPRLRRLGQTSQEIKVDRVERDIKAVKESTTRYRPQIFELFHQVEREAAENLPPPIEIRPSWEGNTLPVGTVGEFSRGTVTSLFPGIGATGWNPPDPHIAVGPNHVVEIVNMSVAFFDKNTGVKTFQQLINTSGGFFGSVGASDFVFDPKAFFDPVTQRFFILGLDRRTSPRESKLCIGVSDDANPDGIWYKYRVEAKIIVGTTEYWMDYPSYACNKDALVVCGNMFGFSGGFAGVQFVVLPKAPLLTGAAATAFSIRDASGSSAQVGQTNDPNVDVIYGARVSTSTSFVIYALRNLTGTPTVTTTSTAVPSFTPLQRDAWSTNGRTFWTVDSRLFNVIYRNGRLYTTHHTSFSSSDQRNTVRWYEIATNGWPNGGTPALLQAGMVPGGVGEDTFFPAINVNKLGDISLLYGRSSTAITGDMMYTARKASDPPGTMGVPVVLHSSLNPNYGGNGQNRWGDYFSVQIDPNDWGFWGVGMVGNETGVWQTHIRSWMVSLPNGPYDAMTVAPLYGTYVSGGVSDIRSSDDLYYVTNSAFVTGIGTAAAIEAVYQLDLPASQLATLKVKAEANSPVGASAQVLLKNWNTGLYEEVGTFVLGTTDNLTTLTAGGDLTRFASPSGEIRAVLRGFATSRASRSYLFNVDLLQLDVTWNP
jgi:hypothetical protein